MNAWTLLAQVGATDPAADTPFTKAIWYIGLPLLILAIIFGGGFMMMRAERRARAERRDSR